MADGGGGGGGNSESLAALGAGLGSLFATDPRAKGVVPVSPFSLFTGSRFQQFLSLGGTPDQLSETEIRSGRLRKQFRNGVLPPEFVFTGGKGKKAQFARAPTAQDLERVGAQAEQRFMKLQGQSLERFRGTPLGSALLSGLEGQGTGQFDRAFERLGAARFGGAAQAGLNLSDPNVRNRVLGPVALQEAQFNRGTQLQAAQAGLGLTRGAFSASDFGGPASKGALAAQFGQGLNFQQGSNIFNAGVANDQSALLSGISQGRSQAIGGGFLGLFSGGNKGFSNPFG